MLQDKEIVASPHPAVEPLGIFSRIVRKPLCFGSECCPSVVYGACKNEMRCCVQGRLSASCPSRPFWPRGRNHRAWGRQKPTAKREKPASRREKPRRHPPLRGAKNPLRCAKKLSKGGVPLGCPPSNFRRIFVECSSNFRFRTGRIFRWIFRRKIFPRRIFVEFPSNFRRNFPRRIFVLVELSVEFSSNFRRIFVAVFRRICAPCLAAPRPPPAPPPPGPRASA